MGILDFFRGGWGDLPSATTDLAPLGQQKAVTFNGSEYVPPLVHGPGATELMELLGSGRGGDGNSAVFACLMALSMAYFEPPVRVYRTDPRGNRKAVTSGPGLALQTLLDHPNPYMSPSEVWFWAAYAQNIDGNAYLEKIRSRSGDVVQLIPRSPVNVKPMTERGSGNLIDWYKFTYAPGKWAAIPVEDMVHLKLGFDDRDHRLGLAPIKRLLRHICADDEASHFATTLLQNFGIPGLVVQTPDKSMDEDKAERIKARAAAAFGNDNRGNVAVLTNGATMAQFGFSPEQLNLKSLHQIPETRIAAVMRVPPAVVGLSVGLEQTSNFASFEQIREQFVEQTLAPLWALRDDKLNAQLLPDFTTMPSTSIKTDLTGVRALQEDQSALHTRANEDLASGGISLNEYRQMIGEDPLPEEIGDCHLVNGAFVPRSRLGEAPAMPAPSTTPRPLRAVGE